MGKHGTSSREDSEEVPIEVWLSDDPSLALVNADMESWLKAHPCNCEATCTCK